MTAIAKTLIHSRGTSSSYNDRGNTSNPLSQYSPALSELSGASRGILGELGMRRFNDFWNQKEGWYPGGEGKQLSRSAVRYFNNFSAFLEAVPFPVNIFMGLEGSLEITWRNAEGKLFDVEFFDDRIEYYFEATTEEDCIKPALVKTLVEKIMEQL